MALTETEKLLLDGLMVFGLDKEDILIVMALLETEEQQDQMIEFLVNHRSATQQDILKTVTMIVTT